jgi:hypothetical protein
MAEFLVPIVVGAAVALAVLGIQWILTAWTDRSERARPRGSRRGSRRANAASAIDVAAEGFGATPAKAKPAKAKASPLTLAERQYPVGTSLIAVGPGRSSPTVDDPSPGTHPDLALSLAGHAGGRSPGGVAGKAPAGRTEYETLTSGSAEWQAADLDARELVESLARGVGTNITADGLEWLIRRQRSGAATATGSSTPPRPASPSPDEAPPDGSPPQSPLLARPGSSDDHGPSPKHGHPRR